MPKPKRPTKYPIVWHELCQDSRRNFLQAIDDEIARTTIRRALVAADIELTDRQIAAAKLRGLTEFDHHKFLVPRKRKAKP